MAWEVEVSDEFGGGGMSSTLPNRRASISQ